MIVLTILLLAETAERGDVGWWAWTLEHLRESGKELLIGGPWFVVAYLIHQVHHRIFHRPTHWLIGLLTRRHGR